MERPPFDQTYSPVEHLPPREQAVERAIVAEEADFTEQDVKDAMAEYIFLNQHCREKEKEKTPEQLAVMTSALKGVNEIISRYGGRPLLLQPDHFHFVLAEELPEDERREFGDNSGLYAPEAQEMFVIFKKNTDLNKALLLRRLIHESLHFNAFQSVSVTKDRRIRRRRDGLTDLNKKGRLGYWLDEAITERLAKSIVVSTMETDVQFAEEKDLLSELLPKLPEDVNRDEVLAMEETKEENNPARYAHYKYDYPAERDRLNAILDDLAKKNPDYLPDREAAFTMVARAYFTGNLLPLGRLLEQTYGKNALRRLMEGEDLLKPEASEQA